MHTAVGLLDTGAGAKLINAPMTPSTWGGCVKQNTRPKVSTATKQPSQLDGRILLSLQLGNITTRVWFDITRHPAVDILLCTTFIDRFIRGIFPSERKVVPWNLPPVPILTKIHSANTLKVSRTLTFETKGRIQTLPPIPWTPPSYRWTGNSRWDPGHNIKSLSFQYRADY